MLYRADPRQPLEGDDAIGVLRLFLHQRGYCAVELVNGELEPELVLLVDDDEQQLVIRSGLQLLRREKLLKSQITGVCVLHLPEPKLGRDLGRRAADKHDLLRRAAEKVVPGPTFGEPLEKFVRIDDTHGAENIGATAQKSIGLEADRRADHRHPSRWLGQAQ